MVARHQSTSSASDVACRATSRRGGRRRRSDRSRAATNSSRSTRAYCGTRTPKWWISRSRKREKRRSGGGEIPDETVEDVGLGDEHLVEAEGAQHRRRARSRRRRSRRPARARGRGCGAARRPTRCASVRNTSSTAARVSRKWWMRSRSYSGRPCSTAATVRDGAREPDERRAPRAARGSRARRRRGGRARSTPRSTAPRARAGRSAGTAR